MSRLKRLAKPVIAATIATLLATGCATNNPNDPFENYNRVMFSVNEAFDNVIFKPVATVYKNVLPDIVQTGVTNFFGNIADVWTAFNNFLQGEGQKGLSDVTRVTVNTIFGLGGLIDVASDLQLTKHHADFGQTLGVWGMEAGPYVVLPILGPSTLRDTIALPAEWYGDPWTYVDNISVRNVGIVVRAVPPCWMLPRWSTMPRWTNTNSCVTPSCNAVTSRFMARTVAMMVNGSKSPHRNRLSNLPSL